MIPSSEYEAIPVSNVEAGPQKRAFASTARSFSSYGSRIALGIVVVSLLAFVSIHRHEISDLSWNRLVAPSRSIIPGDLSDICRELSSSFSYGCWNSGASDTDLCNICRYGFSRTAASNRVASALTKERLTSSVKQMIRAFSYEPNLEIPPSIRGVLSDMCNEMSYSFSSGCWNSGASDTDLCKICRYGFARTLASNRMALPSAKEQISLPAKQAVNALSRVPSLELPESIRGALSDMCKEMSYSFSYGCWNSGASDTDLCKICRYGFSRTMLPNNARLASEGEA